MNKLTVEPAQAMEVDKEVTATPKKVPFHLPRIFRLALANVVAQGKVHFLEYYDIPGIVYDYAFYKANNQTSTKRQRTASAPCTFSLLFHHFLVAQ